MVPKGTLWYHGMVRGKTMVDTGCRAIAPPQDKLGLTMPEESGSIWVLDNVDR